MPSAPGERQASSGPETTGICRHFSVFVWRGIYSRCQFEHQRREGFGWPGSETFVTNAWGGQRPLKPGRGARFASVVTLQKDRSLGYDTAMETLRACYDSLAQLLSDHPNRSMVEPFDHVLQVERLRLERRPKENVRLLLIAESHVRTRDISSKGAGFVFEPKYYTPWWQNLFLPSFGAAFSKTTRSIRDRCLHSLTNAGFWLLDASVLSLSGYRRSGTIQSRPFERTVTRQIVQVSWETHVRQHYELVMQQASKPVVVAFVNVAEVLSIKPDFRVKFEAKANSRIYRTPEYGWGTHTFKKAAKLAGLDSCLSA